MYTLSQFCQQFPSIIIETCGSHLSQFELLSIQLLFTGSLFLNRVCGNFFIQHSLCNLYRYEIHLNRCNRYSSQTQMISSILGLQLWSGFMDSNWVIAQMNGRKRNGMISSKDYQRYQFLFANVLSIPAGAASPPI